MGPDKQLLSIMICHFVKKNKYLFGEGMGEAEGIEGE